MGIYCGVDGILRSCAGVDLGVGTYRHSAFGFVGVDGVVRPVLDLLEQIERVDVIPYSILVYNVAEKGNGGYDFTVIETGIEAAEKVGSISFGDNRITVVCPTPGKGIEIRINFRVIFSDGHYSGFGTVSQNFSVSVNASYKSSAPSTGFYSNNILGGTNIGSGTQNFPFKSDDTYLGAYTLKGTATSEQIYNFATIGGKTFPMVVREST